eukprot:2146430-Amphidinium_carterae.1
MKCQVCMYIILRTQQDTSADGIRLDKFVLNNVCTYLQAGMWVKKQATCSCSQSESKPAHLLKVSGHTKNCGRTIKTLACASTTSLRLSESFYRPEREVEVRSGIKLQPFQTGAHVKPYDQLHSSRDLPLS